MKRSSVKNRAKTDKRRRIGISAVPGSLCRLAVAMTGAAGLSLMMKDAFMLDGNVLLFCAVSCIAVYIPLLLCEFSPAAGVTFFAAEAAAAAAVLRKLSVGFLDLFVLGPAGLWNGCVSRIVSLGFNGLDRLMIDGGGPEALGLLVFCVLTSAFFVCCTFDEPRLLPVVIYASVPITVIFMYNIASSNTGFLLVTGSGFGILSLKYYRSFGKKTGSGDGGFSKTAAGGYAALLLTAAIVLTGIVPAARINTPAPEASALTVLLDRIRDRAFVFLSGGASARPGGNDPDTREISPNGPDYTGQTVLRVTAETPVPIYLRTWAADSYSGGVWTASGTTGDADAREAELRDSYFRLLSLCLGDESAAEQWTSYGSNDKSLSSRGAGRGFVSEAVTVRSTGYSGLYAPVPSEPTDMKVYRGSGIYSVPSVYGQEDGCRLKMVINDGTVYTMTAAVPYYRSLDEDVLVSDAEAVEEAVHFIMKFCGPDGSPAGEFLSDYAVPFDTAEPGDAFAEEFISRVAGAERDGIYPQGEELYRLADEAWEEIFSRELDPGIIAGTEYEKDYENGFRSVYPLLNFMSAAGAKYGQLEKAVIFLRMSDAHRRECQDIGYDAAKGWQSIGELYAAAELIERSNYRYCTETGYYMNDYLTYLLPGESAAVKQARMDSGLDGLDHGGWKDSCPPTLPDAVRAAELVAGGLAAAADYDIDPDGYENGKSPVVQFLATVKKGYCVHYATAAALILRSAGIPARYCEGYVAKDFTESGADGWVCDVKDSDAHAWVEIYVRNYGWVSFEVTESAGPSPDTGGASDTAESGTATEDTAPVVTDVTTAPDTKVPQVSEPETDVTEPAGDGGFPRGAVAALALVIAAAAFVAAETALEKKRRALLSRMTAAAARAGRQGAAEQREYTGYVLRLLGYLGLRQGSAEQFSDFVARVGSVPGMPGGFEEAARAMEALEFGGVCDSAGCADIAGFALGLRKFTVSSLSFPKRILLCGILKRV